jgi:hypothetical protein
MKRIVFVMFLMLLGVLPVMKAQDEPTPTALCSLETVQTVTNAMAALITQAQADATAGDLAAAAATLAQMDNAAGDLRIQCSGLVFEGTTQDVIGPVSIPAGTYIATATTEGFMSVVLNVLSGECGQGTGSFLSPGLFNLSRDEATTGAESVMSSTDCRVLIEVSNVQAAWSLVLEQVQ